MELECAHRRMGLPKGKILAGSALMARGRRRAHSLPSLLSASPRLCVRSFPYLDRAEQIERAIADGRLYSTFGRTQHARSARLLLTSQLRCHESLRLEGPAAQQHVIDGPAQLGRQNAQRLSLAVLLLQPSKVLLPRRVSAQEQGR